MAISQCCGIPFKNNVVPKPRCPGDDQFCRISFSKQELLLARELPTQARDIYLSLKVFYKSKIKPIHPDIQSYHMKTAFYWWLEEQDPSQWEWEFSPTNALIDSLIEKVKFFLSSGHLPHYFIPSVNLLPRSALHKLHSLIYVLHVWISKKSLGQKINL